MTISPPNLGYLGLKNSNINYNLPIDKLIDLTISAGMGKKASSSALMVDTGRFTGRSPKDRFIVEDRITEHTVDWNEINIPFSSEKFDSLKKKITAYISDKQLYVRDAYACADDEFKLAVRVINELPWQNIFVRNMFIEPSKDSLLTFMPNWHVIAAPGFKADPAVDGTRQENFAVISFEERTILIGGTAYTGEIKKGIFSVLNYLLPKREGVLSMHCSANMAKDFSETAIFFGLSGTGKTTLSADPERHLIGDDEHGWSQNGVFNFEGGCYAKTINLSKEGEPEIYNAIKEGALLENVRCFEGTDEVDFANTEVTQNTRVSYPISHIDNAVIPSRGGIPNNIFLLTYDAFGVLPPISRLNIPQAMYQFISGFTSKVAGTEDGVVEPQATFSACYGSPFLPLHPAQYAGMLGRKIRRNNVNVWLVNTGLSGGSYGTGERIKLKYTRALIKNALNGSLNKVDFEKMPVFGFEMPTSCEGVPSEILNPRKTWVYKDAYDEKLNHLAELFTNNFTQFQEMASAETMAAAPKVLVG